MPLFYNAMPFFSTPCPFFPKRIDNFIQMCRHFQIVHQSYGRSIKHTGTSYVTVYVHFTYQNRRHIGFFKQIVYKLREHNCTMPTASRSKRKRQEDNEKQAKQCKRLFQFFITKINFFLSNRQCVLEQRIGKPVMRCNVLWF